MRRPAGLNLYLALTARRRGPPPASDDERPRRPPGPVLWLHTPDRANLPAATELTHRLADENADLTVLFTCPAPAPDLPPEAIWQPVPHPSPDAISDLLSHWRPDTIAQIGGTVSASLLAFAGPTAPFYLVQPDLPLPPAIRIVPGLARRLLAPLDRILLPDEATTRRLRRIAGPASSLETLGPLDPVPGALPCNEAEREALAQSLAARPAWLAAGLPMEELPAVIAAHRAALRLSHRLLLIVVPDRPGDGPEMARRLAEVERWAPALRSAEDEPEEDNEVYVADTEGELGLWYRLCPLTYLGGSLSEAGARRSPLEPAALGSAVLHGPRQGNHAAAFTLLARAHATREIRAAGELGEAVGDLLAADRAAALAHDAWSVTTAGAEVTDRLARLLLGTIAARSADT